MNRLAYQNKPISSVKSLSRALSYSNVLALADKAPQYYLANKPQYKKSGGVRQTYQVKSPLKKVQRQIVEHIFHNVKYPSYLFSVVKNDNYDRGYVANAKQHAGQDVVIHDDIADFFHSIKLEVVLKMWQHLFKFPEEIADVLIRLTTFNGFVPQGASTSPYIANLILWDREPKLFYEFAQQGFIYSRYVDDIIVSKNGLVTQDDIHFVTSSLYNMLRSVGLKPNRSKRTIEFRNTKTTVHGLNIVASKPTICREKRSKIRAAVRECEVESKNGRTSLEYTSLFDQTMGRVAEWRRVNPKQAIQYKKRLLEIKPICLT